MSSISLGTPPGEDRVLVTVFLRGGADGLALVPPVGDDAYRRVRPRLGVPPARALPLDGPFGLAPELAELHPFFLSGQLAVVHAVGSDDDSRSHFVAQELMERGGVAASGGWLGRWLRARAVSGALTAVTTGREVPDSLRGAPSATALAGLMELAPGPEWSSLCESLGGLYARDARLGGPARDALAAAARVSKLRTEGVRPEHGAQYAERREGEVAHAFGQQLAQVAALIRARIGLVVACVDLAGWDSHFAQETIVAPRLRALALGLSAFATDLGTALSRVTVVVMSEFGRRVAENASLGTDHGRGGVMLVLGGGTPGGMHCRWPGLDTDRLEGPGDLPVVHDYRDVLAAVLARHGEVPMSAVFPGHAPRPLAV
ncbi:MAG TPA: DUF1501 domain-containing protein [Myxococcaceae bacterium]|nr:DUF1501 domain-containing protein [Myxococcaceae bacterium]